MTPLASALIQITGLDLTIPATKLEADRQKAEALLREYRDVGFCRDVPADVRTKARQAQVAADAAELACLAKEAQNLLPYYDDPRTGQIARRAVSLLRTMGRAGDADRLSAVPLSPAPHPPVPDWFVRAQLDSDEMLLDYLRGHPHLLSLAQNHIRCLGRIESSFRKEVKSGNLLD